ncbi:MAG: DUF1073 domain-containing protein [Elusimicrobiota bacterium]|jgi:phage-related protein (TIGR01555 family)|nr:DUF1073 domain-containing protein [Elusimicrobiota bacterium]
MIIDKIKSFFNKRDIVSNKKKVKEVNLEQEKDVEKSEKDKNKNIEIPRKFYRKIDKEGIYKQIFQRDITSLKVVNNAREAKKKGLDSYNDNFNYPASIKRNNVSERILDWYGDNYFIGYQACSILRQNPYIDKACTVPCKDAISVDYKLSYVNEEDNQKDLEDEKIDYLKEIKNISDKKYKIKEKAYQFAVNNKTFGVSYAFFKVEGADWTKPFNIDGVKKGSYKGIVLIEPYWIVPELDIEGSMNVLSENFYEPEYYNLPTGERVHKSWLVKVVNVEVADILKPTYYFGGISLPQLLYDRVYASEKVANEAPNLALTKRLLVVEGDVDEAIANPEYADKVLGNLNILRDNYGIFLKKSNTEVQQLDTILTDFDELIMTQFQLVCAIAEMPATKLLKITPRGFNATGEYDMKDYIQSLQELQNNVMKPLLERHLEILTKSEYGRVIELDVMFNAVDMPSEKELAEVENLKSSSLVSYVGNGIISAEEARQKLMNEKDNGFSFLNIELPEELEEIDFFEADIEKRKDKKDK